MVVLLLLGSWWVAEAGLRSVNDGLRRIAGQEDKLSTHVTLVVQSMTAQQASLHGYLLSGDYSLVQQYQRNRSTMADQFRKAVAQANDPIERRQLQQMRVNAALWQTWAGSAIRARQHGVLLHARHVEVQGLRKLSAFQNSTSHLLNTLRADRAEQLDSNLDTFNFSHFALSGATVGAIVIVFLLTWRNSRLFENERGARRAAEEARDAVRASADAFQLLFARNPQPMWVFDLTTLQFLEVNAAAIAQYGYTRKEFLGMKISDIRPQEDVSTLLETIHAFSGNGVKPTGVWQHVLKDQTIIDVEVNVQMLEFRGHAAVLVLAQDVTDRKRAADALAHQALHDGLTDLPNRILLRERLESALRRGEREGVQVSLLLMDLDRFKDVNDTYGHHYGDLLLLQLAKRLTMAVRASDTVARLGGDEFAVLLPDTNAEGAVQTAEKILHTLDAPFTLETQQFSISASIGLALYPEHAATPSALLQRADVAMYVAKRSGGECVLYSPAADEYSPNRLEMIVQLRHAIESDALSLHYQPKMSLRNSDVRAVEALVRWDHPTLGMIPPDDFIHLAEHTGLIHPLSTWVVNAAVRQCACFRDEGVDLRVAVNLSARNLNDTKLAITIATALRTWHVEAERLEIEVTESAVMDDPERATRVLDELHQMGIRIAIDDFGTGYSSLAYLKRLPVDEIKIHKSFVLDMWIDRDDYSIVRATIGLGHELGLETVAEGVENEPTLHALRELGCDVIQGYFVSPPIPAHQLTAWLRDHSRSRDSGESEP